MVTIFTWIQNRIAEQPSLYAYAHYAKCIYRNKWWNSKMVVLYNRHWCTVYVLIMVAYRSPAAEHDIISPWLSTTNCLLHGVHSGWQLRNNVNIQMSARTQNERNAHTNAWLHPYRCYFASQTLFHFCFLSVSCSPPSFLFLFHFFTISKAQINNGDVQMLKIQAKKNCIEIIVTWYGWTVSIQHNQTDAYTYNVCIFPPSLEWMLHFIHFKMFFSFYFYIA